jgi:hypothetical protein
MSRAHLYQLFGGVTICAAGFFQRGDGNETAHADLVSLCGLSDFLLFAFGIVGSDRLPYHG